MTLLREPASDAHTQSPFAVCNQLLLNHQQCTAGSPAVQQPVLLPTTVLLLPPLQGQAGKQAAAKAH